MSGMYEVNPNESYEGWEDINDDSQEFVPTVNLFQQQQQQKGTSEHAKSAGSQWEKKVHTEEHQNYDIVIEIPGVKDEPRNVVVFEAIDGASNESHNDKSTKKFISLPVAGEKMELEKKAAANSSNDD